MLIPSLIAVSLADLAIALLIWRSSGSRQALVNGIFASLALLYAASLVSQRQGAQIAFGLPFLASMLLLGRGVGTFLRSQKRTEMTGDLRSVAIMWLGAAAASLACTAGIYMDMMQH